MRACVRACVRVCVQETLITPRSMAEPLVFESDLFRMYVSISCRETLPNFSLPHDVHVCMRAHVRVHIAAAVSDTITNMFMPAHAYAREMGGGSGGCGGVVYLSRRLSRIISCRRRYESLRARSIACNVRMLARACAQLRTSQRVCVACMHACKWGCVRGDGCVDECAVVGMVVS